MRFESKESPTAANSPCSITSRLSQYPNSTVQPADSLKVAIGCLDLLPAAEKRTVGLLAHPAFLRRHGLIFLDFHAEADAAVAVRLIANVDHARGTAHFLRGVSGDFGWHSNGGLDGHADLEGSRGRKEEPAPGDVESLGEMLGLVRSNPHRTEA